MTDPAGDDGLLEVLRELAATRDPEPEGLRAAAKGALTWRTIDAELAELSFDSFSSELAGVRADEDDVRMVTFDTPGLTIELEIRETGRTWQLVGQLSPPQHATVGIVAGGQQKEATTDDLGRFEAGGLPAGAARLVVLIPGVAPVVTPWTIL